MATHLAQNNVNEEDAMAAMDKNALNDHERTLADAERRDVVWDGEDLGEADSSVELEEAVNNGQSVTGSVRKPVPAGKRASDGSLLTIEKPVAPDFGNRHQTQQYGARQLSVMSVAPAGDDPFGSQVWASQRVICRLI